jgi:hypothetical protein
MVLIDNPLIDTPYHLVEYHPYWVYTPEKTKNPKLNANTRRIMDLKSREKGEPLKFANEICGIICEGIAIAVVPSHDPKKVSSGIRETAETLAKRKGRIDATGCLVRHKFVEKKSEGGERSETIDLESIRVDDTHLIAGQSVLLLDDVTTSGGSLSACRELLLKAGAKEVQCFAIGRTTH